MERDKCRTVTHADIAHAGFLDHLIQVFLVLLIKGAGGLIEEGEAGFAQEEARESDPLLLAEG